MLYAKSNPEESIEEHTDKLIQNLNILKKLYGSEISQNCNLNEKFWELLKIICIYHDIGKVYTPFQNIILERLHKEKIKTDFDYNAIKHEQLSPMFVPTEDLNIEEKKLVYQSIFYHHERVKSEVAKELVDLIIQKDILPKLNSVKKEINYKINGNISSIYLGYVGNRKIILEDNKLYIEYCMLKGMLHRLDHSSSAGISVENETSEELGRYTEKFMKYKKFDENALQMFCKNNTDKNILVIGSTGIGKTEAATLWSGNSKTFFTLPLRISINAIYDRIRDTIGYKDVGLLHSTAIDYLENKDEKFNYKIYEQTKNLYEKVTVCTIDQIFPFVFKYNGYEKMYATLGYSKVIIDEIQAYSPRITAIILKGIKMINDIGGKFMIMTATLPRIYKDELEKMGVEFKFDKFLKPVKRHKISINNKNINDDINMIIDKAKNSKALIIVNTVDKANEIFTKLNEKASCDVELLHSRFIQNDRAEKENRIKAFSDNRSKKGIWITTQIVEASLDIDFDYLFTEMSTLDSLFQRLGRCYRSREYLGEEPNIYVYTKDVSGIKYVYDEEIYCKSIELLEEYNNKILTEKLKADLVDRLYSKEMIGKTNFYRTFKESIEILDNISKNDITKSKAQKMLRNIESITVIPKSIYAENLDLFLAYGENIKNNAYKEASKIKREIIKLTTTISKAQAYKLKDYIVKNSYDIEDVKVIDLKYDDKKGIYLEKNIQYELEEKFL